MTEMWARIKNPYTIAVNNEKLLVNKMEVENHKEKELPMNEVEAMLLLIRKEEEPMMKKIQARIN
jgi:hypothetical protein